MPQVLAHLPCSLHSKSDHPEFCLSLTNIDRIQAHNSCQYPCIHRARRRNHHPCTPSHPQRHYSLPEFASATEQPWIEGCNAIERRVPRLLLPSSQSHTNDTTILSDKSQNFEKCITGSVHASKRYFAKSPLRSKNDFVFKPE